MLDTHNKQYHIAVAPGEIGEICILPGDPGRCRKIAELLDEPEYVSTNREFEIWNGKLGNKKVTVCSTGIGGPSTAIAVEELVACGAETIIRIGTCGGISLDVKSGDVVIASGAVRQDGTSLEYAPAIFPAVADASVLFAIAKAAKNLGYDNHIGVVQAKDSFYGQHSPHRMPTEKHLCEQWEAWKRLGVLASEMESSTLYVVGASLGIKTGSVFLCVWNQERFAAGMDDSSNETHDTEKAIKTAVEAVRLLIKGETI